MNVLVCALPGSGNHMLSEYLRFLGCNCEYAHGPEHAWRFDRLLPAKIVVPVRHPRYREASVVSRLTRERKGRSKIKNAQSMQHATEMTAWWIARVGRASVKLLSFEALIQDPGGVLRDLCGWLGVAYRPPPFEIYDANEKYR